VKIIFVFVLIAMISGCTYNYYPCAPYRYKFSGNPKYETTKNKGEINVNTR
jgi:hypothetical protein